MTTQQRPPAMGDRLGQFHSECPRAGTEFPDFTAELLDGGELTLSSLRGRAVVLEVGSFT